jgi:hypothetical protein
MEGAVGGGVQPVLSQQQQQQLMMQRLGGMSGNIMGGAFAAGLNGSGLGMAANGVGGASGGSGGGNLTDKLMMQMQLQHSADAVSISTPMGLQCCQLLGGGNP